jgi:hypothetical protein
MRLTLTCIGFVLMSSLTIAQEKPVVQAEAKASVKLTASTSDADAKPAAAAAAESKTEDPAAASDDLTGWWTGTWLSHTNGHNGPINGYFTKIDDDHYCVHFNGMFWEIFPFQYNVVLSITERDKDSITMSGSSSLGLLFGTFSYTAKVTGKDFTASYCSNLDNGVFSMARWQPCEEVEDEAADSDAGGDATESAEADGDEDDSGK